MLRKIKEPICITMGENFTKRQVEIEKLKEICIKNGFSELLYGDRYVWCKYFTINPAMQKTYCLELPQLKANAEDISNNIQLVLLLGFIRWSLQLQMIFMKTI